MIPALALLVSAISLTSVVRSAEADDAGELGAAQEPAAATSTMERDEGREVLLPQVLAGVSARLGKAGQSNEGARALIALPEDRTLLEGYVAALLPVYMRSHGWEALPAAASYARSAGEDGPFPSRPPGALREEARKTNAALLAVQVVSDEDARILCLQTYPSGEDVGVAMRQRFRLPADLAFLLSAEAGPLQGTAKEWIELLDRIFSPASPSPREMKTALKLAEGQYFFEQGLWQPSSRSLREAADSSPDRFFVRRVCATQMAGEAEKAVEEVNAAIKEDSGSGALYALKAWVLSRQGQWEDGLMLLEQARLFDLAEPEKEGLYWFGRGLMAEARGSPADALASYRKAAELAPGESFIQLKWRKRAAARRMHWRRTARPPNSLPGNRSYS